MTYTESTPGARAGWIVYLLLALALLGGLALRVWNVNFDQGIGSHPDERSTACFYATTIRLPSSWEELRDPKQSPLNPLWDIGRQTRRSFTYGHFPLYLGVAAGEAMHRLAPLAEKLGAPAVAVDIMSRAHEECGAIAVAGRLTIALLDTLTIGLLFLLGRLLFGSLAGLLAAAFYAFSAQAIQLSHFFAMDPASTTFVVLAVYGGVRMWKQPGAGNAMLTGIAAGLAIASKFSSLPVLAVPVTASLLVMVYEGQRSAREGERADGRLKFRATTGIVLALVAAALTFFVTSPYAVLDWRNFIQATLVEQGRMVRGIADMPFTRQYRNTAPYWYFIQQQVAWGLWWPLGLAALAGTAVMLASMVQTVGRLVANWVRIGRDQQALVRLPAGWQAGLLIAWSWVVPYFAITGAFLAKFNRYMSPLLPFAALFAAGALWLLWHWGEREQAAPIVEPDVVDDPPAAARGFVWQRVLAGTLALLAVAGGVLWSAAYVNGVYRGEHTWISASRWIYENVPEGSTILWELWDDPLPKSIPGEPGMDIGTRGLRNIDWSPYEEDTAEKFEILKAKLREADYVVYSSKRIYDSVDELPERYPMTTRYYDAMWDGSLGYELALEATSPPALFGRSFDDRHADESWSLYDHPQVTVFRKVRDLSDEEYDALLGDTWQSAVRYDTGATSALELPLVWLGLRGGPGAEYQGAMGRLLRLLSEEAGGEAAPDKSASLMLDTPLSELAVVDNYRWNAWASERPVAAAAVWWLALSALGWVTWPILFRACGSLRDRGYFLSRTAGWLLSGWLLWALVNTGLLTNSVRNAWLAAAVVALAGAVGAARQWRDLWGTVRTGWPLLLAGEALVGGAYVAFILLRMANPDLWQPWYGGEKFMEFAFLNGILRSPEFPPVDPHFAGGYINYYYFGIYLVAYLIKLTGIHAEVAFNLTIAMLFALTVSNAFCIAYSAYGSLERVRRAAAPKLWHGFGAALLAPFFIAVIGNLDGFAQVARKLSELGSAGGPLDAAGDGKLLALAPDAVAGLAYALTGRAPFPAYDFWAPSRVVPYTINEFPYWSFLFADLHPHVIGIPLALLFCGLLLALLSSEPGGWRSLLPILLGMAFLLGALSSVNLWELPTYLGLGALGLAVRQFRYQGRVSLAGIAGGAALYAGVAFLAFLPFFRSYTNVVASGVGLVREPDPLRGWILVWGLFLFVMGSWVIYATVRRPGECRRADPSCVPAGDERAYSLAVRQYDRLPRVVYLHRLLVQRPTFAYLLGLVVIPLCLVAGIILAVLDHSVLGLCVALLGPVWMLLWKRGTDSDPAALLVALLSFVSLAILAGTQVVYLRDFLQGGEWYRMNTLFKFFIQVWVLLGLAAAIAVPRLWAALFGRSVARPAGSRFPAPRVHPAGIAEAALAGLPRPEGSRSGRNWTRRVAAGIWAAGLVLLIAASLVFTAAGTPARLSERMVGWRPEYGTLNGMDYMREGSYTWPDGNNTIELKYDWEAIGWLLENVRGNPVIAESSEVDYYRAGSSRVASMTGISGLRGAHENEQRPGELLSRREQLHREFWSSPDIERTQQIIEETGISLVYAGQLERTLHADGVAKLEQMAVRGLLYPVFENEGVTVYGVTDRLAQRDDGAYVPVASPNGDRG